MPVVFEDYSVNVKETLKNEAVAFLYEVADEILSRTSRNYDDAGRVGPDGGHTKGSFDKMIDEDNLTAHMGSGYENAIWEEYGTGIYALHGDGRKDVPWRYKDEKTGKWYTSSGKTGHRPFFKAYTSLRDKIIKEAERRFGAL